ncbi:hypothetical protein CERSUDRAFT_35281, partial [Gelatoporia subvermispora B]
AISFSPLLHAQYVTPTLSVPSAPACFGVAQQSLGVVSTYLAGLRLGDRVRLAVHAARVDFYLQADPAFLPVMFCAGS